MELLAITHPRTPFAARRVAPWTTGQLVSLLTSALVPGICSVGQARQVGETPLVELSAAVSVDAPRGYPLCSSSPQPCRNPSTTFPGLGWAVSARHYLNTRFAITGDIAHYVDDEGLAGGPKELNHVRSFTIGPTVHVLLHRGMGPVRNAGRIFGQVLIGIAESDVFPDGLAIQPGGGADFSPRTPVGFRFEADYRVVPRGGGHLSGARALLGIVVRFGSRDP